MLLLTGIAHSLITTCINLLEFIIAKPICAEHFKAGDSILLQIIKL